ncbi:translation initiation factor IF-2 N-terminal domain-containing protein [Actinokineospora xionganensis]|uniref:Translation initiation factor IF-2 N-terminal domain-containing protein n=1 Tax=Actinokineospora xionganensis TaxID=2684470 RepID=A0ABR7LAF6_9PSEU|nr:translation initiation factor IF-2 N-terminal domain-containing protein [Actinokineospora xionganensis]MBC6449699.1 translation initiation factor IF-2 N-terminal domain-containing protein [Actinokineospora xionganensis]
MSDMSNPAGSTGGATTTATQAALAELPAKVRVHALAKLLEVSSKDVISALTDLGEEVRGAQSSVSRDLAIKVAEALTSDNSVEESVETVVAPVEPEPVAPRKARIPPTPVFASASPLFLPPEPVAAPAPVKRREERDEEPVEEIAPKSAPKAAAPKAAEPADDSHDDDDEDGGASRRRRRGRRGRGRGKGANDEPESTDTRSDVRTDSDDTAEAEEPAQDEPSTQDDEAGDAASRRRRRRRRRKGGDDGDYSATETTPDDPPNTVVHVREVRDEKTEAADARNEVRSVRGSTRLEAKRQRRRDGREAGRRRAPILSEAEFLARREAVDRAMIVRENPDRTQIAVLEDGVLVEHFVTSTGTGSLVGNVYLGRVQNVLPSMEAAFVDIGRGRNAVLYAGEVDWDAAGLEGKARKIEQALSTGDSVLVQVTKDPIGHKGARLTTQISLPGRFLVYVPGGGATGISRKLPENERRRLKDVLKRIVPEDAGVIIRTASEGISEEELGRDVRRLQAQWQVIKDKSEGTNGVKKAGSPSLLYEEPDLLVKVVRDLFTEDFSTLAVQGETAWETIDSYVRHVAPELLDRVRRHVGPKDVFAETRVDEQLLKALDRKVWLPSGGYLIIDRTEAMTVIDVNTGKFTGSGGNLEETVTRNNLESAEEIVRQLRLRDIGGIIVIDFIDMVLESNRDLVLRRLTECLGRDRTRHQVAEVTSLGLVQMTRKRVGTGLLEAFSNTCEHCKGRGVVVSTETAKAAPAPQPQQQPAPQKEKEPEQTGGGRRRGRDRDRDKGKDQQQPVVKDEPVRDDVKNAVATIAKATVKHGDDGHDTEPVPAKAAAPAAEPVAKAPEPAAEAPEAPAKGDFSGDGHAEHDNVSNGRAPEPVVEAPAAPVAPVAAPAASAPRRRSRRTASRPAGPPVNAGQEG